MNQDQKPQEVSSGQNEITETTKVVVAPAKRKFLEPEISQPVDALEATTFFQTVDSGASN